MFEKENNKLNEFSKTHGFKHTNLTEGTRTNPTTLEKTLLDIVLCYNIKNFVGKKIFHTPFSDHALVATMFNFKKIHSPKIEFESRVLNPKNILSVKESLGKILADAENQTQGCWVRSANVTSVLCHPLSHASFTICCWAGSLSAN